MILIYADDPGAVNYLAPLSNALSVRMVQSRFIVDPSLCGYINDRQLKAEIRKNTKTPTEMLQGTRLLVVGTSENRSCFGNRLIDAARGAAICSVGAVDMEVNAAFRFMGDSNDPLKYLPDYLVVPDPSCGKAFEALGVPVERISVCGHPHYDVVRERKQVFLGTDPAVIRSQAFPDAPQGRPVWLFVAEGVDQLNPSVSFRSGDYTLHGRGLSDFRACIVLEEIVDAANGIYPKPWIALRLHPKNRIEDFAPVLDDVDQISERGDPLPLVWAADLVIGMTSMLLLESCLLDKPHISVIPRVSEKTWLATLANGVTPVAVDRESVRVFLSRTPRVRDIPSQVFPSGAVTQIVNLLIELMGKQEFSR